MVTIFFIAFEFPPSNNGGVFRPLSFAKYLPAFGIKPVVFTLAPESIPLFFGKDISDKKVGQNISEENEVVYISLNGMREKNKFKKFFEIRDRNTDLWEIAAEKVLIEYNNKYKPKLLLVTAPPFTMATFGRKMAKKLDLPLILDMRDAWTFWNMTPYRTWFHYYFTKREESYCFKASAAITVTSQQTINDFRLLHPTVPANRFNLVTNGFEGELEKQNINLANKEKFIIGYSGGFYYDPNGRDLMFSKWWKKKPQQWFYYVPRKEDWLYRSPYFIFKTFNELKKISQFYFNKIELHFIGLKPAWFDSMVSEFGLSENVKHLGVYSHEASIEFQNKCDMLLITSSKVIGGNDYSIAGKTFEYLSMEKPILSFVCTGAQKDLLEKTGMALLCDPDFAFESASKIIELLKGKIILKPDYEYIASLTRKNQAQKLSQVILQSIKS